MHCPQLAAEFASIYSSSYLPLPELSIKPRLRRNNVACIPHLFCCRRNISCCPSPPRPQKRQRHDEQNLQVRISRSQIRENADPIKTLQFADNATSKSAIKTKDLRFDVHRNTQDATMATDIIQANSQATDNTVKEFIKGQNWGPPWHSSGNRPEDTFWVGRQVQYRC